MLLELDSFYHDAERCLDDLIQEARRSDIKCDGKIGSGTSHSTILETAETEHIDVIVLERGPFTVSSVLFSVPLPKPSCEQRIALFSLWVPERLCKNRGTMAAQGP
jgi:hypothetical protein